MSLYITYLIFLFFEHLLRIGDHIAIYSYASFKGAPQNVFAQNTELFEN